MRREFKFFSYLIVLYFRDGLIDFAILIAIFARKAMAKRPLTTSKLVFATCSIHPQNKPCTIDFERSLNTFGQKTLFCITDNVYFLDLEDWEGEL